MNQLMRESNFARGRNRRPIKNSYTYTTWWMFVRQIHDLLPFPECQKRPHSFRINVNTSEISPSVIHRESFKADETRRGNASLYDKQTPTASLQIQQAATSMSTTEKPRQIRRTTANKDENIVIQAVDKHGFWMRDIIGQV
uniref:Uncharacterized protein n=1 Tax=Parascaris univalens TaxID=6257 RepID=A0A915A2I0_PARUN